MRAKQIRRKGGQAFQVCLKESVGMESEDRVEGHCRGQGGTELK